MKKTIIALTCILALSAIFTACGSSSNDSSSIPSSTSIPTSSVVTPPIDENSSVIEENISTSTKLVKEDLGFEVSLPAFLENKMVDETTTKDAHGETITTVNIYYQGATDKVNVVSFDEMSKEAWEKIKAEGGPLGIEMGISDDGRVVVMNNIQSNPFKESDADYDLFQTLPSQMSIVKETFKFI